MFQASEELMKWGLELDRSLLEVCTDNCLELAFCEVPIEQYNLISVWCSNGGI